MKKFLNFLLVIVFAIMSLSVNAQEVERAGRIPSSKTEVRDKLYGIQPYKIYSAKITQSSTSAPTITVLKSNFVGRVVWTRNATGTYTAKLVGAFKSGKVVVFLEPKTPGVAVGRTITADSIVVTTSDTVSTTNYVITPRDSIHIVTAHDTFSVIIPLDTVTTIPTQRIIKADGKLNDDYIEIRVYVD